MLIGFFISYEAKVYRYRSTLALSSVTDKCLFDFKDLKTGGSNHDSSVSFSFLTRLQPLG